MEPEYYPLDMAAKESGIAADKLQRLVLDGLLPATMFSADDQPLGSYPQFKRDIDEAMIDGVISYYCERTQRQVPCRYLAIHRDDLPRGVGTANAVLLLDGRPSKAAQREGRKAMRERGRGAASILFTRKPTPTIKWVLENPAFISAVNDGRPGGLPVSKKTARMWIRDLAPPEIIKGGRPKNVQPKT
ncbi:MAG: hypothetical protein ACT4QA_05490 [Panacagrimonas sp.]